MEMCACLRWGVSGTYFHKSITWSSGFIFMVSRGYCYFIKISPLEIQSFLFLLFTIYTVVQTKLSLALLEDMLFTVLLLPYAVALLHIVVSLIFKNNNLNTGFSFYQPGLLFKHAFSCCLLHTQIYINIFILHTTITVLIICPVCFRIKGYFRQRSCL